MSWVTTVADTWEVPFPRVVESLGLKVVGRGLPILMIDLPDHVIREVAAATGLSGRSLRAMTLDGYCRLVIEDWLLRAGRKDASLARLARVNHRYSNFCPECLEENGHRWLLQWRAPWVFLCIKHRKFLASQCPGCGGRPQFLYGTPHRRLCTNHGHNPRPPRLGMLPAEGHLVGSRALGCGAAYKDARAQPVADPGLVELQERIFAIARIPRVPAEAGHDPSPIAPLLYLAHVTAAEKVWHLAETTDAAVLAAVRRYCDGPGWKHITNPLPTIGERTGPGAINLVDEPLVMAAACQAAFQVVGAEDFAASLARFGRVALADSVPERFMQMRPGPDMPSSVWEFQLSAPYGWVHS